MEKISGILKNSPRVQAADLRDANPVRPGTPSFGRPEGVSSLAKSALTALEVQKPAVAMELVQPWKSKDQQQAEIAADLANRFFSKPAMTEPTMSDERRIPPTAVPVDMIPMSIKPFSKQEEFISPRAMNFNTLPDPGPLMGQPDGYFPRGSFISRLA